MSGGRFGVRDHAEDPLGYSCQREIIDCRGRFKHGIPGTLVRPLQRHSRIKLDPTSDPGRPAEAGDRGVAGLGDQPLESLFSGAPALF